MLRIGAACRQKLLIGWTEILHGQGDSVIDQNEKRMNVLLLLDGRQVIKPMNHVNHVNHDQDDNEERHTWAI